MSKAAREGARVRTTDGQELRLADKLGQGGQGAVYAVEGRPDLCVKVFKGASPERAAALRHRLARLRALPATETLVLPRAVLEVPDLGYVMHRVVERVPLGRLAAPPPDAGPIADWYAGTGGLRGRLLLGIQVAWAFQDLHSRGLAYCDLSFDNVFVRPKGRPDARLIDCDNLTVHGAPAPRIEGTPWFIAPEVLAGTHRPDAVTDAWSLAVLLYHLLVLTHPLLGDGVREASPEVEQAALRGQRPDGLPLPWVDHPDDESNRTRRGLPRPLVLSGQLSALFHRTFAEGRLERASRPAEGQWAEALARAADATETCAACGNTHWLRRKGLDCPWCGAERSHAAVLYAHHPDGVRPLVLERGRRLFPRHLRFRQGTPYEEPLARLDRGRAEVRLRVTGETPFTVFRRGADGEREEHLPPGGEVLLQVGDAFALPGHNPRIEVKRA